MTRSFAHIVFARGEERIADQRERQEDRRKDVARKLVEHRELLGENARLKGAIEVLQARIEYLKGEKP